MMIGCCMMCVCVCVCTQTFVSSISLKPYIKSEVSQYVRKLKLAK